MSTKRVQPVSMAIAVLASCALAVPLSASASASVSADQAVPMKHATSLNRAGYGVVAGSIKQVSAAWRQPSATCTSGATYANFRISMARLGKPLAVGTATDCHGGHAVFYAWTNWGGQREKLEETVAAGDEIRVTLGASKDGLTFEIDDDTQGWGEAAVGGEPAHFTRADILVQARTAASGILPLTDFDRVFFRQCMVNGQPLGTQHSHEIVMKTPLGDRALPSPISRDVDFAVYMSAG